jgi:hypothetical protein
MGIGNGQYFMTLRKLSMGRFKTIQLESLRQLVAIHLLHLHLL